MLINNFIKCHLIETANNTYLKVFLIKLLSMHNSKFINYVNSGKKDKDSESEVTAI